MRDDIYIGVERVDRRVGRVREERSETTQTRLDEPRVAAQKAVQKNRHETAVHESSTMLRRKDR